MDEILKEIIDTAKQVMLRDAYHSPLLFVRGKTKNVFTSLPNFGDTNDERVWKMLNAGTQVACKSNVGELDTMILVTEAWMSTNLTVQPSKDPKRIEVLLINSLDARTGEEEIRMFEIIRDRQQKVIDLKDCPLPGGVSAKGSLLPAFQKGYQLISPVKN